LYGKGEHSENKREEIKLKLNLYLPSCLNVGHVIACSMTAGAATFGTARISKARIRIVSPHAVR
jgi:hypothetical protein